MRAVTVIPGGPGSARLDDVPEPGAELGSVLVEALAVGVCGTDVEIAGPHGHRICGQGGLVEHRLLGTAVPRDEKGLVRGLVGVTGTTRASVRNPGPQQGSHPYVALVGEWHGAELGGALAHVGFLGVDVEELVWRQYQRVTHRVLTTAVVEQHDVVADGDPAFQGLQQLEVQAAS